MIVKYLVKKCIKVDKNINVFKEQFFVLFSLFIDMIIKKIYDNDSVVFKKGWL